MQVYHSVEFPKEGVGSHVGGEIRLEGSVVALLEPDSEVMRIHVPVYKSLDIAQIVNKEWRMLTLILISRRG